MKLCLVLLLVACAVISGCAPKGDLTPEQARRAIEKFTAGKGTFKMRDKDDHELKTKEQFDTFSWQSGKSGLIVYLSVRDMTATDEKGRSVTISAGTGGARFFRNPDGSYLLDDIYLTSADDGQNHFFKPGIQVY